MPLSLFEFGRGTKLIFLFSDFGLEGPYVGQVKAVLNQGASGIPIVDLLSDAPSCDPCTASYLLAAYDRECRDGDVVLAVVDPGVGGERKALALLVDGCWYVGPDNGLFHAVINQSHQNAQVWQITWRPEALSATFHGRDLFAPIAARLACGSTPSEIGDDYLKPIAVEQLDNIHMAPDSEKILYVDRFGNLITGYRATTLNPNGTLAIGEHVLPRLRTFSDVSRNVPFCYENSNGLMEVAVNKGSAAVYFKLSVGDNVTIV